MCKQENYIEHHTQYTTQTTQTYNTLNHLDWTLPPQNFDFLYARALEQEVWEGYFTPQIHPTTEDFDWSFSDTSDETHFYESDEEDFPPTRILHSDIVVQGDNNLTIQNRGLTIRLRRTSDGDVELIPDTLHHTDTTRFDYD